VHIEMINAAYHDRCNTMLACVNQYFPEAVSCVRPEGGLFIWVELPANLDARKVSIACLENGVAVLPGDAFFATGSQRNALRLNFSNSSEERIVGGMKRIGEVLHRELRTEAMVK